MVGHAWDLSWPRRLLRRGIRSALEAAATSPFPPSTNDSLSTNLTSLDSGDYGGEEEPEAAPEPSGPTGPSFPEKALDTSKQLKADGAILIKELPEKATSLAERSPVPIWVFILIFVTLTSISCLFGLVRARKRFRQYRKTDEGRVRIQKLAEHQTFGKYVPEKWLEPDVEMKVLNENAEVPAEEGEVAEEEEEKSEFVGRINYKMDYDFNTSNLTVTVIACEDLTAMDASGTSDPYVKVSFLGDKNKKYQFETKVHRGNLSPQFNETFVFKQVTFDELMGKTVAIQAFDYDRFGSHDLIGEINIRICQIDITQPIEGWKNLEPAPDEDSFLGLICLSLRYAPAMDKLTVAILECKNLKQMDFGGAADPFVKIRLFKEGKKFMKKTTSVKECTLNPYYNEAFIFEVPQDELKKCHLVITALDYDLIGGCDPIGRVAIGPNQKGEGRAHWKEMVDNPKRPIAKWHTLEDPDEEKFKEFVKPKKKK